jgi:hypothetical protein
MSNTSKNIKKKSLFERSEFFSLVFENLTGRGEWKLDFFFFDQAKKRKLVNQFFYFNKTSLVVLIKWNGTNIENHLKVLQHWHIF